MADIGSVAAAFFAACETGKGWAACKQYCKPDATFACQADALAGVATLEEYVEWMRGLFTPHSRRALHRDRLGCRQYTERVRRCGCLRGHPDRTR